jgi:phage/plasmid-associated DNA primase
MMDVDTTGFIPQKFPMTKSKMNSHAKRLDKVYDYIKQTYVLAKVDMNITPKELYANYKLFCDGNQQKAVDNKTTFNEKLKSVGIEYRKKGNHYYIYDSNQLLEIANRHKWIHELDEDELPTDNSVIHSGTEQTVDEMYAEMLQEKDDEIARLRQRIAELEAPQSEDLIDTL